MDVKIKSPKAVTKYERCKKCGKEIPPKSDGCLTCKERGFKKLMLK